MNADAKRYGAELYRQLTPLTDAEAKKALAGFVERLAGAGKLKLAPQIIEAFEEYAKKEEGWTTVELTTAKELDHRTAKELEEALAKKLGGKTELKLKTDPALVGGAVIRTGDTLLDASVKRRLEMIKRAMTG